MQYGKIKKAKNTLFFLSGEKNNENDGKANFNSGQEYPRIGERQQLSHSESQWKTNKMNKRKATHWNMFIKIQIKILNHYSCQKKCKLQLFLDNISSVSD